MRPGLLLPSESPALDEARSAPFWKADVDDIEVPRDDRLGENLACLPCYLGSEVTIREVRQREHLHTRGAGERRDVGGGGVERLVGATPFLGGERGLVDEHVGLLCCLEHGSSGPRIACEDDFASGPRRAENLLGTDLAAVGQRDRLALLEPPVEGARRHAERARALDVEAPGTQRLDERIAVRRDAVLDTEGGDPIVGSLEHVSLRELDQLELVGQLPEDAAKGPEQVDEPGRPVDGQGRLPAA